MEKIDKLLQKVRKLLEKAGLDETKIADILDDIAEDKEEEGCEEPKVEEEVTDEAVTDAPTEEPLPEEAPTEEAPIPEPAPQEEVPEAPIPEDVEAPIEEAPVPEPAPSIDPELIGKLEEQGSLIEALTSKVQSLEDALRKAKILTDAEGTGSAVGVDQNVAPAANKGGDPLNDILAEINGNRL